jgi:hypothetical protein
MNLDVSTDSGMKYAYENINNKVAKKVKNPIVLAILVAVVILYVILFNVMGKNAAAVQAKAKPPSTKIIELFAWALFLLLVFINGLQYLFEINVQTVVKNLFDKNPQIGIKIKPNKGFDSVSSNSEVFHIGDNVYTYDEAKILCNAHDGELASYEQIEKAYNDGAEWCSYGWSKDQMALYPTQKSTYNRLKNMPGSENSCGRPGINGGYIKNKNARYGVNCYAPKRKPTNLEKRIMNTQTVIPTQPETEEQKKINFYKKNISKIVKKPFNSDKWSAF